MFTRVYKVKLVDEKSTNSKDKYKAAFANRRKYANDVAGGESNQPMINCNDQTTTRWKSRNDQLRDNHETEQNECKIIPVQYVQIAINPNNDTYRRHDVAYKQNVEMNKKDPAKLVMRGMSHTAGMNADLISGGENQRAPVSGAGNQRAINTNGETHMVPDPGGGIHRAPNPVVGSQRTLESGFNRQSHHEETMFRRQNSSGHSYNRFSDTAKKRRSFDLALNIYRTNSSGNISNNCSNEDHMEQDQVYLVESGQRKIEPEITKKKSHPRSDDQQHSSFGQSLMQRSLSAPSLSKSYLFHKYFSGMKKSLRRGHLNHSRDGSTVQLTPGHEVVYGGATSQQPHTPQTSMSVWSSTGSLSQAASLVVDDVVHLPGPSTEDSLIKTLHSRYHKNIHHTHVGSVLLLVNPHTYQGVDDALTVRGTSTHGALSHVASKTLQDLSDTASPQSIILSGTSGSGKTCCMLTLVQQLLEQTGQQNTDLYHYLTASLTVLLGLGTASTQLNSTSSRMSHFAEFHLSSGVICNIKLHSMLLDHSLVSHGASMARANYHIFYYMMAGLTDQEKARYYLLGYGSHSLRYLYNINESIEDNSYYEERFSIWKKSLSRLGIPVADIIRVLAAILLLGNISFEESSGLKLNVQGETELQLVSSLLQVTPTALYKALTTRSCLSKGQVYTTVLDSETANRNRDLLAQALYSRTVSAIIKRANNTHRASASTRTTDSYTEDKSRSQGNLSQKLSPSPSLSSIIKSPAPDGDSFIAVLDMYGFEDLENNGLEQLCINLASETLQHYYNTLLFKTTEEAYIEEGIQADMDIYYFENAPIVELLSSQKTGILSLLEAECLLQNTTTAAYCNKVRIQHSKDKHFKEGYKSDRQLFTINHFAGPVTYEVTNFMETNKQVLSDDVIWLFAKCNCTFGFVSHLFGNELKSIQEYGAKPRGQRHRLTAHYNLSPDPSLQGKRSCLSEDFHAHLDNVLKTLVQTKPHFIRCLQSNQERKSDLFDRGLIVNQIRSFQVLETLHLMTAGFPHKMRYRAFNSHYRILHPNLKETKHRNLTDNSYTQSKQILDHLMKTLDDLSLSYISAQWALGKKNIFLSESVAQLLEKFRLEKREESVLLIQSVWRRHSCHSRWPMLKRQLQLRKKQSYGNKKLASVPPRSRTSSHSLDRSYQSPVHQHSYSDCSFNMTTAPELPSKRRYTVQGNMKIGFPQSRIMTENYSEAGSFSLCQGQEITVIGVSDKTGWLLVLYNDKTISLPYQVTEIITKPNQVIADV